MMRVLIVDDEPLGRQSLRTRLRELDDVEIVGEACDGHEAVQCILDLQPDLVFLDIQMPEMNGFEVLAAVAERHLPAVVFVSAFDRFALQAFEVHALDYLLKPWSLARFEEAMRRARAEVASDQDRGARRVADLLAQPQPDGRLVALQRLVVRDRSRVLLLPVREVQWIRAAENYVELHSADATHLARYTMKELQERLDPDEFVRIHRSYMVRRDAIQRVTPGGNGDFEVLLAGGPVIPMSRTYRKALPAGS